MNPGEMFALLVGLAIIPLALLGVRWIDWADRRRRDRERDPRS